jgi:hypothetical protein
MEALRSALNLIRDARRPYVTLNVVYYGLVVCAMAYTAFDRSVQQALMEAVGSAFAEGPLATVWEAYSGQQILRAIGLTFGINLAVGSFVTITLPSLIVPFSGLLMAGLRAMLWGVIFSPQIVGGVSPGNLAAGVLLVVLIFLEGQGYVLATLGAYRHGIAFIWPRSLGLTGRRQGYLHGLREQARIYLLVAGVLLIAALYEVLLVAALPALL